MGRHISQVFMGLFLIGCLCGCEGIIGDIPSLTGPIEYSVAGGIDGDPGDSLTVNPDGTAIYLVFERPTFINGEWVVSPSSRVEFTVAPEMMTELQAKLAWVNFALLKTQYGTEGNDLIITTLSYQGYTVEVGNPFVVPSKLQDLMSVLQTIRASAK